MLMKDTETEPTQEELQDSWSLLSSDERLVGFKLLAPADADDFFLSLNAREQVELLFSLPEGERRLWFRLLAPDDAADVIQEAQPEERHRLLALLDEKTRTEVTALLAYAEDAAGGLMNPRYARVRPEMSVDEAITYLRRQARERVETIYYAYVLDAQQRLLGVVSFRDLFASPGERKIRDVMRTDVVTVSEQMDQEAVSLLFAQL
jgi:magnesium transporter